MCFDVDLQSWSVAALSGAPLPPLKDAALTWSQTLSGFLLYGGSSYYQLSDQAYAIQPTGLCSAEVTQITLNGGTTPDALLGATLTYHDATSEHLLIGGQSYYQLSEQPLSFQP